MASKKHTSADPFLFLQAIDRLEIGDIKLEKKRLTAPYTVIQNGKTDAFSLSYVFEENVFEPDDPLSCNLASMIAAQVAMNYGLFCTEIVFRGHYDKSDRQFIRDMTVNTAREIYVKKFLEPNPFLTVSRSDIPVIKKRDYVQAKIIFDNTTKDVKLPAPSNVNKQQDTAHSSRYAILSSGGKDSLLTFGLLRELGKEIHPIFINESGRHWFTALNAYRYFSQNIPNTARVWTNADRMFAWMLRHLPFVRKDFENIRADEYAIRLWTVAVFLFGALPLVRKRHIGRLCIGDEFDTTERTSFKGITHYNGLFDQSRYFDNTLTRYFRKKGWNISQFSVLRQLSEMLIEKILVERYPDLQRYQVSCHAAHKEDERIHPCGKCEKCRRIVSMVLAIDGDPRVCGYSDKQITECLKDFSEQGVHQESEGAEHLGALLFEKGIVKRFAGSSRIPKKHPEIMKLRFDPDRSPFETFPLELRAPLYRIYLEHAQGTVKKSGRIWMEINPLTDPSFGLPYPFETPFNVDRTVEQKTGSKTTGTSEHLLAELTWKQAQQRFREVDLALLPVGSIEQHGPHLALDTDAFDADHLAKLVAASCSDPKPLVLPLLSYGVSYHHDDFAGTISISPDTLSKLVYEIGISVARHGITKLVIINGHGGNAPALHFAAQMINRDAHIFTCVDTGETSDTDIEEFIKTPNDVHAGEIETSSALAVRPDKVYLDQVKKFVPKFSSRYLNFSSKRGIGWYARTQKISPTGVMGDPTKASREKGEIIWDLMVLRLVEFIEDIKGMSLDEIYQRKY